MTAAVNNKTNTYSNEMANGLLIATKSCAAGALAGRITQSISPIGGAIFGVVSEGVSRASARINKAINKQDSIIISLAISIIGTIAAIFAGHLAVNALGIAFTMKQSSNLFSKISLITLGGNLLLKIAKYAYKAINTPAIPKNSTPQTLH